jgi:hypothetical protein
MFRAACVGLFALAVAFPPPQELVLQKEETRQYHRPGCDVIRDGRGVLAMTRAQAEARGLKPHADCDPAQAKVAPDSRGEPGARGAPAAVLVFVDAGKPASAARGKLYHRESCARLGKERRKLSVDDAAKQYWPCPKCRPPIRKRK